jgi:hypothetical protein
MDMRFGPSACKVSGRKPERDHYNDLDIQGVSKRALQI